MGDHAGARAATLAAGDDAVEVTMPVTLSRRARTLGSRDTAGAPDGSFAAVWIAGDTVGLSEPVPARVEVLTSTPEPERVQRLLIERYKLSYRVVMLIDRVGRRLRGERSVADGAALAITVE